MEKSKLTPIFVDTQFVVALISERDQDHKIAVALSEQLDGKKLLTTDAILLEIGNALSRHYREDAAAIIEDFLTAEEVQIVHLTPNLLQRGLAMFKRYHDKSWGLVDCISFVVMREYNITQALTNDQHFKQARFETLMR